MPSTNGRCTVNVTALANILPRKAVTPLRTCPFAQRIGLELLNLATAQTVTVRLNSALSPNIWTTEQLQPLYTLSKLPRKFIQFKHKQTPSTLADIASTLPTWATPPVQS